MRAVFLDRDGTVIVDPPDKRVDSAEKIQLFPDTIEALRRLAALDYAVFFVTNQAGIAEGRINEQEFWHLNNIVLEKLAPSGIKIRHTYFCPHGEGSSCACRKPQPGLIVQAAKEFGIDLKNSWTIGDRESDILAGQHAGTKTILVRGAASGATQPTFATSTLLAAIEIIAKST